MIPADLTSGPESGGTAVAQAESIPGVEWKWLMDNELLRVLWAILEATEKGFPPVAL